MKNHLVPCWPAAILLLLLTGSCQSVIDLDLPETGPRLMIEGNLADDGHPCTVLLSRSTGYTATNAYPAVSGARIILRDDAGGRDSLAETGTPGRYRGTTLTGQSGRRYTLRVEVDGEAYVAVSSLPAVVPLTGLRTQRAAFNNTLQLIPEFQDPAGVPNAYLFRQYRNGRLNKSLFVQNDEFTDGKANALPLFTYNDNSDDDLLAGDSVRVDMQTIDAGVYTYLLTLTQLLQGASTDTPANPQSNFSGNVLGYFSAHTLQRRSMLLP